MQLSCSVDELTDSYRSALDSNFPAPPSTFASLSSTIEQALERTEHCFSRVILRGYQRNGVPYFNHLHADQRAVFTYFAANSAWRMENTELAARFFLLNKMQNGLVCMYDTELPDIFLLIHTVGTMLGKARYSNYFVAYQNVTVGTEDGREPSFDEHTVVYGGSMILGATHMGRGSIASAQTVLIDETIPPNSVVSGRSPSAIVKARKRDFAVQYWDCAP